MKGFSSHTNIALGAGFTDLNKYGSEGTSSHCPKVICPRTLYVDCIHSLSLSLFLSRSSSLTEASGCGENWYGSSNQKSWSDAIQSWYNEVKDWRYGQGSINGKKVGHFTQVHLQLIEYTYNELYGHSNTNIMPLRP